MHIDLNLIYLYIQFDFNNLIGLWYAYADVGGGVEEITRYDGFDTRRNVSSPEKVKFSHQVLS